MVGIADIQDASFTEGLPAEVHLDYIREGMLGGPAHRHHVDLAGEVRRLRADNEQMREDFRRIEMLAGQHCPADASVKV